MNKIGDKLKYFRKRAGMNQQDLELEIEASPGSISRIEANKVNPSKETVVKMARILDINDNELDYITGITANPVTQAEIDKAIKEVEHYFNQKVFAYLIDERWRIWKITETMRKSLKLSKEYIESILGTPTIRFTLDPSLKILDRFSEKGYIEMLDNNLRYYYKEVGFMHKDPFFLNAVEAIKANPISREIWEKINYEKDIKYNFKFGRKVYFKILDKFDVTFIYTYEPLLNNSRFKVVEFIPESKFTKILSNLLY